MVDHPEKISQEKLKQQAMVRGNCQSPQILQSFAETPAYAFLARNVFCLPEDNYRVFSLQLLTEQSLMKSPLPPHGSAALGCGLAHQ